MAAIGKAYSTEREEQVDVQFGSGAVEALKNLSAPAVEA
jgi:hypothetical protein